MKKHILTFFLVLFMSLMSYSQTTIFEDDFESYATGSHPTPWVIRFPGVQGVTSEDVAASGIKSFKLVSYPNWTRVEAYPLSSIPDHIFYEGSVYVNETNKGGYIGFGFKESSNTYRVRNAIQFKNDAEMRFRGTILQSYTAHTWYKIKVYCDFVQNLGKVWIDDVLMLEDTPLSTRTELVDFCILPNNFTASGYGTVYFDDIKLYMDTTPPDISVTVAPDMLWPPNHKMHSINAIITATDLVDPDPQVVLVSITSNEPDDAIGDSDGNTINDIQDAEFGTEDYEFSLRAERSGEGNGRIYTITYSATDFSGNSSIGTTTVTVPHDKEKTESLAYMEPVTDFVVLPNFPNPFNPETQIRFLLPHESSVVISIYDMLGRQVNVLVNKNFKAGYHSVIWEAKDLNGNSVPSGVYIYRIQAGEFQDVKKMILIK